MSAHRWPRADAAAGRGHPGRGGPASDAGPVRLEDRWLTVAEVASELRVNPATVRQWVSKRRLTATRAGQRKLLIRRSDLDRMLEAPQRALELVDPSLCLQGIELLLREREIGQDALVAELDALLAHIREALLGYLRGRRAITTREHCKS